MKLEFTTQLPIWFAFFCLILAAGLAFILYYKDRKFKELAKWKLRMMAIFRFVFIFVLSFLLLSPLLKSLVKHIEKPLIILAQDNSSSVLFTKDSTFYQTTYKKQLNDLKDRLEDEYQVRTFTLGEELKSDFNVDFSDKSTHFDKAFKELQNSFYNRNVGALIIASDGIYNRGGNPARVAEGFKFPIITVALGDTSLHSDLSISELNHNKIAFLGNNFPLQIYIGAKQLSGNSGKLRIIHKGENVFEDEINIEGDSYSSILNAEIQAESTGLQRYTVIVDQFESEVNVNNNQMEFLIDIIDTKQKILILANATHPDVAAIRNAIESNDNFEVDYSSITDFKGSVADYNMVILHQLPAANNAATDVLAELFNNKIPSLFIIGGQTNINNLNNLGIGVQINQTKSSFEETQPSINPLFELFELDEDEQLVVNKYPPLITPFGSFTTGAATQVLMHQKIKGIETANPLVAFTRIDDHKIGIIAGEGIWRWRLNNFLQQDSHQFFDELITKSVQYLSLRIKKERFIVNANKLFGENQSVKLNAELYNESFEPLSGPEIELELSNENGKVFTYSFNQTSGGYKLDAGRFDVGDYSYTAHVDMQGERFTQTGRFSVYPINIESINTVADHQLLYQLAASSNGKMYYPSELEQLFQDLQKRSDVVSVSSTEEKIVEMINLKWIFFVLLFFISIEWFLRKFYGGY